MPNSAKPFIISGLKYAPPDTRPISFLPKTSCAIIFFVIKGFLAACCILPRIVAAIIGTKVQYSGSNILRFFCRWKSESFTQTLTPCHKLWRISIVKQKT